MRYYSLQTAPEARTQLAALARGENWVGPEITDLTADLSDFSATAALVSSLDLVISVDTSVAHLAGALGKPVWLLNRHDGCWRWLREVSNTPWYSSMRIFRQRAPGEWDGVMRQVGDALLNLHLGHNLQHREPIKQ